MVRATRLAARRGRGWGAWFWTLALSLLSLVISVAAYDYLTSLLARFPALGMVALGLTAVLALVVLAQVFRELLAFRRLARIDGFRADAAAAHAGADRSAAQALSEGLSRFYAGRDEVAWGAARLAEARGDMLDADAIILATERSLFATLDAAARREIEAASRTVAGATALIPLALADVLTALSMNVRMIRRIADIYGAHSGFFGSWRLLRSVATHLIATGMVSVGDDMIHSVLGGSALARVSRRFGEGVINGALTARVGIAAMEVCRPLPFAALPRPSVSNVIGRSLTGLFGRTGDGAR
jgi:putative membrane protein